MGSTLDLTAIATRARRRYAELLASTSGDIPWWTAVVLTASSQRQADLYSAEVERRRVRGALPESALVLSVADPDDQRVGSGGATFSALQALARASLVPDAPESIERWWESQRVLVIHSGGDSRRLPQYSLSGKLFAALPMETPWGEASTVFDEFMALSTLWVARLASGLVLASGDVVLTLEAGGLGWDRPGVSGVAIRQPPEVGSRHGVYVTDPERRVYTFLQKPTAAEVRAVGGMLDGERVAVDTGLLRFDAHASARLTRLAGVEAVDDHWSVGEGILAADAGVRPVIDLYRHMTFALTGQWRPPPDADPRWQRLADALHGLPFHCDIVAGDFTHVGTTALFRSLLTEESALGSLYETQQRLGRATPPNVRSAGVIVDSILAAGGELGPASVVIECHVDVPVAAARGAILHGLENIPSDVQVPENTVVHQIPVSPPDSLPGVVIRAYGVQDDPKDTVESGRATWFGRPILEMLAALGLDSDDVWPEIADEERTLWSALLYPVASVEEAWDCARWMMGTADSFSTDRWRRSHRLSLASSANCVDAQQLTSARARRVLANWQLTAIAMAQSGSDVRPLLAQAPGIGALAAVGRALSTRAEEVEEHEPTEAASRSYKASRFLSQAGLADEAEAARAAAFRFVQRAVEEGVWAEGLLVEERRWHHDEVEVSAPVRVDFGGGWSDTPPFCIDWGGAVLNAALTLGGEYPIRTLLRRIEEPVIRCVTGEWEGEQCEWRNAEAALAEAKPGSRFAVPAVALQMAGILREGQSLETALREFGGGLEFTTTVNVPMGSGLGTSSVLGATVLRALVEMLGLALSEAELVDQVSALEQRMTTGGGWQDQAGGVFPGVKLVTSRPGPRQQLRVAPVGWSSRHRQEFLDRFLLHYTGLVRVAKDLLTQVVGGYLAREVEKVQVLHSIKTLAVEMSHAMSEGDWDALGSLMDSHWEMNKVLDPNTTNAPINACLESVRGYLAGAKLAGAGGGGFLMLLAKSPEAAEDLRRHLSSEGTGQLFGYDIALEGLRVSTEA